MLKLLFAGTPDVAVPSLKAFAADPRFEVAAVLTRSDAPTGRGRKLKPSPVKVAALELGIPVIDTKPRDPGFLDTLQSLDVDIAAVIAYGNILPADVLEAVPLGWYNLHFSNLPLWRGAAPVQRAVLAGDERAGVSIMRVVHELDAGAYCAQASTEVADKPCAQLMAEVAELGARALVSSLADIEAGRATWTEQDASLVTYAHKVEKAEMRLDAADGWLENARRVQASTDAAPARCVVGGKGVRVLRATAASESVAAGDVLAARGRVLLGCSDGALELLEVKPDGKREMDARSWAAGLRVDKIRWARAARPSRPGSCWA